MKKNFTKFFVLALIMGFSFSACKKSSDNKPSDSSYSMKLTLNGKVVTYNTCLAVDVTANGVKQFSITASNKGNESFYVSVLTNYSTIKAGQTFHAASDYLQPNTMMAGYSDTQNNIFNTVNADPSGSVTITEVTSTTVKGTFTGIKLYAFGDDNASDLKYTATSGTFVAEAPKP